jgi:RNA polymerase sigma-70 factor, ECF subfamily
MEQGSAARVSPRGQATAFPPAWRTGAAHSQVAMDQPASLSSPDVLVEAVARGSELALKRLYALESPRLYGIALRIVRRPEIAAEVLQDAFVQIWQNARTFVPERGAAAAWMTGIVRFRALDAVRRHGREILSGDSALGDSPVEPEALTKLAADADAQALRRCLETLEENQRRSVMLAFVEGFSHGEIAKQLSAPLGTVKSWVRRGLMALKGCLSP